MVTKDSVAVAVSAVDEEDLPYDEWLQELRFQVNEERGVPVHTEVTTLLQKLRMEQEECRYAFRLDYKYDVSLEETNVKELRRKADQTPDKYKICIFRQDMTGRAYAVPQDKKSADEIPIMSKKRRGHALNSDKVLVEVLENKDEQEVEESHDAEREIKISGRVVGIIEHNANPQIHKFVCYLDPRINNVMVPINRSFPKMIILGGGTSKNSAAVVTLFEKKKNKAQTRPERSPRREVEVKYAERHHKLFVVCYREWPPKTPYPLGAVVEELDHGDTEQNGLKILRLVHGIKDQCEPAAIEQMHQAFPEGWSIPDEAVQKREDFRTTKTIFTVDPPESTDLDDAISCVCLPGQRYEVGVHIADASYFIQQDSSMDKDAYERGTTFYHPFGGDAYHMLPKDVILRLLSLLPGQDRLALSVIFTLDHEGQIIIDQPIIYTRSVIKSCKRLTYADAEKLIVDSNSTSNAHMCVAEPIRYLDKLSRHRRLQRLGDIHMVYNTDDDDEGALSYPHAHVMIEELMLMTNNAVAKQVLSRFPECTPLHRQLAPSQEKVETWKRCHDKTLRNSIRLSGLADPNHNDAVLGGQEAGQGGADVLVAAEVWQKVRECCESKNASRSHMEDMANLILQDENHPQHALAQFDLYAIMESAEYVVSTSETTPEKQEHYSLQMRAYTQFTSPIRRYIDLVVHRMLVAGMENSKCPYTAEEMAEITHHYNNQHTKSKRFGIATKELKLALKLKEAPLQVTTFVEGITESSMKLLIPYRRYIQSRRREIPFSVLQPFEKPVVNKGFTDVQVTWKCSMYDYSRKCQAESPASTRVTNSDVPFTIPEDKWQEILQSIKSMYRDGNVEKVRTAIGTALIHAQPSDNPFTEEEGSRGNFQRSYKLGDPCRVQMHAQMMEGMLTPKVQLFNMTPHLDICADHRSQPIQCFSRIATNIPGREENIKEYKSKWLQILSMISCHNAVSNDDTIIIQNVPITWRKTSSEFTGHFQLEKNFLKVNHIQIWETRKVIKYYLCIHLANLDVETKALLQIKEYDNREHRHHVGPFNAKDWEKQTCVLHCSILKDEDCQDCRTFQNSKSLPVHFVVHQKSVPLPEGSNDHHVASTVEIISKPEPIR
ncbi:helicase with zinc finger domain 2-like [Strongylocentrotus purpuratus]|uniref:RNB domain-containing protein n=1 Tax=Strongylocentrotus purpuratus TaxID=7668 RepID=A0A7M7SXA9_STRPU|nr:helicase with zinc finger domain 2-like [Strongylocentrotus purpuratus]